jgi:hypothetical protein
MAEDFFPFIIWTSQSRGGFSRESPSSFRQIKVSLGAVRAASEGPARPGFHAEAGEFVVVHGG